MTAVSALEIFEDGPDSELKRVFFTMANTTDQTHTLVVTLADHGISATGLLGINSWVHTTDGSVITSESNTSTVSAGVLTVTIASGTDNDFRVIEIIGKGAVGDFS